MVMRHRNSFAGISGKWLGRAVVGAGKGAYLHCGCPLELTQSLTASEFFIGLYFSVFLFAVVKLTELLHSSGLSCHFKAKNVQGLVNLKWSNTPYADISTSSCIAEGSSEGFVSS